MRGILHHALVVPYLALQLAVLHPLGRHPLPTLELGQPLLVLCRALPAVYTMNISALCSTEILYVWV